MKNLRAYLIILFGCLLLFGCNNEEFEPESQSMVAARQMVEKNNQLVSVLKYTKEIQWDNAIISNGKIGRIIEIPLVLEGNLKIQSKKHELLQAYNRLLFKIFE